ncbi:amidohydrolase [Nocardioides sp.]|uniref:amidohydrolase n=1 Tax=Nocardioides sp. TaxID=35761 RepID=UPI0035140F6A
MSGAIDLHQHWWSPRLREVLGEIGLLHDGVLHLDGEPPYPLDLADHDLAARRAQDGADGIDVVLYSLSSPLGLETLEPRRARDVLTAWHADASDLPPGTGLWAAAGLIEPDPAQLAEDLRRPGVVGLQVPATALATPQALERLAPLLAVLEDDDRPLLVHPGPARPSPAADLAALPGWWPALTDYVAQQQAAWFAWRVAGRALLPRLRVGFVALAGLAPLLHERSVQRGGPAPVDDEGVFYETSSFGAVGVGALLNAVGVGAIVHGTDRPYAAPLDLGATAPEAAVRTHNARRFLGPAALAQVVGAPAIL